MSPPRHVPLKAADFDSQPRRPFLSLQSLPTSPIAPVSVALSLVRSAPPILARCDLLRIPLCFQWLQKRPSDSARHGRDMGSDTSRCDPAAATTGLAVSHERKANGSSDTGSKIQSPSDQAVELHVAAHAGREVLAVDISQCSNQGCAVLVADLAVVVPAAVIKPRLALLRDHDLQWLGRASRSALRYKGH